MKKISFTFFCIITSISCISQTSQFEKSQINVQVGIGFISTLNAAFNEAGVGNIAKSKWTTPPISASADYGVTDEISVGIYFCKAASTITVYGDEAEKDKFTIVGVRGLYHFDIHPKFDTYGGAMLGVTLIKWTRPSVFGEPPAKETDNVLGYQLILGGRYRFQQYIGAFLEIGYGVSVINIGLNLKFK